MQAHNLTYKVSLSPTLPSLPTQAPINAKHGTDV